jgi:hypothetical protein
MRNSINSSLGFGPMSPEIIEGIVKTSVLLKIPLMLICTQNQIDWNGGYVHNWSTREYVKFVNRLRNKYPGSRVYLCRDHCGPGFRNNSVKDVYKTINNDIENNFDLIHIDFSKFSTDKKLVLDETKKAVLHILKHAASIRIEVGTEENVGALKNDISEIKREVAVIKEFVDPEFFVVQTGSLVREINQVGSFNRGFVAKVHDLLGSTNIKLKEHNADYLDGKMIEERRGLVDAMNIAPQLGVVQTSTVLNEALIYGVDAEEFLNTSYDSKKWKKWLHTNSASNRMLCAVIAGHYNFTSVAYKRLISRLQNYCDVNGLIIEKIINLVTFYVESFTDADGT